VGPFYFYYPINGGRMWLTNSQRILSYDDIHDNWKVESLNFNNPYFEKIAQFFIRKFLGQDYQAHISNDKLKKVFMNGYKASDSTSFAAGLYDTLYGNYSTPKLTIIHDLTAHHPFIHAEDGAIIHDSNNMNPLDYYPQHVYAGKILISTIDMILEKDPDAVIAIQADHGLHGNTEEEFKAAFGDKADAKELWNSTMSALRVPPEYKTGEEHYALETPLNMTRYLVNSFVGKNYEYVKGK